jgi:chromosomal replication initiator protein
MYRFVAALKAQDALRFKDHLRGVDLLLIDDMQFLQGKSTQQEFCHTLNALMESGRQVVVAADRPPAELDSLDDRMRSRLSAGLVVDIRPLGRSLRLDVLRSKLAAAQRRLPSLYISDAVLEYVADQVTGNGRDLEGAFTRIVAHNQLTRAEISIEMAEHAIRDLVRNAEPKRVRIEHIQKIVARHFNISRQDIVSSRRNRSIVRPRQISMYLAKTLTDRSFPEIGRRFGGRDHTTVLHAVRKIDGLMKEDRLFAEEVELLRRLVEE